MSLRRVVTRKEPLRERYYTDTRFLRLCVFGRAVFTLRGIILSLFLSFFVVRERERRRELLLGRLYLAPYYGAGPRELSYGGFAFAAGRLHFSGLFYIVYAAVKLRARPSLCVCFSLAFCAR